MYIVLVSVFVLYSEAKDKFPFVDNKGNETKSDTC